MITKAPFVALLMIAVGFMCGCVSSQDSQSSDASQSEYQWKNVQIVGGGFVDGYIFHPAEKGLCYARTDMGGAYRWNPKEMKWEPLLDWVSYDDYNLMGIESIALDPTNPEKLFLACGTYTNPRTPYGEILISNNRGESFQRVKVPFKMGGNENGRGNGERMMVDPNNGNVILMGTRNAGLWRSDDGGLSWKQVKSFPDVEDVSERNDPTRYWRGGCGINGVVFNPSSGDKGKGSQEIYVSVSLMNRHNLFVTRDGGQTWSPLPGHPVNYRPTQMVLSADGMLYLTYGSNPGPMPMIDGAVWKYNTHTCGWKDITPEKPTDMNPFGYAAVSVDASDSKVLVVTSFYRPGRLGGEEIFRSKDGGQTWRGVFRTGRKFDFSRAPYLQHTPIHWMFDVEIDPFDSDHVLFTTGYGGHVCYNFSDTDQGDTTVWHSAAPGIEETVALELLSPSQGPHLYSAIGDYCGFAHYNLDQPQPEGCFINPHFANTNGIACAELQPNMVVRVGMGSHHSIVTSHIGYSVDAGKSWQPCKSLPLPDSRLGHIAVSANGKIWVWTPDKQKPFVTFNAGETWNEISGLHADIRIIADRKNPYVFYGADVYQGVMYFSEDGGISFQQKKMEFPSGNPRVGYFRGDERGGQDRLYSTPGMEGDLWFASFSGLLHSVNKGDDFIHIPDVEEIHAFGFGKSHPDFEYPALYLVGKIKGTRGIFRSDDMAQNWIRINDDQHQYGLILHVTGDPKKYGRVYVGTHGRGIVYGDPVN